MDEPCRIIDKTKKPDREVVGNWIGKNNFKRWVSILEFIEKNYSNVFPQDDWTYGGKKHGWGLRFKKSKSFCTLIPEKDKLLIQIVFGGKEREEVEKILSLLSPIVRKQYREAPTFHDGKWLAINIDNDLIFDDIKKLFVIKRKPRKGNDS